MTARHARLTVRRVSGAVPRVAESRPLTARSVVRPPRATPLLRPSDQRIGPTRREILALWEEMDVWSCAYCDVSASQTVVLEIDHVIPLSRGGLHEWFNLAPACRDCNCSKSDHLVDEWQRT
jgi:5-methylcytosine-specific restriction endonuclease McrA